MKYPVAVISKTIETAVCATDFINASFGQEQKKADSFRLIELKQSWSGLAPTMWGLSLIGIRKYHEQFASGMKVMLH
jgi:hypothetical protein